MTDARKRQGLFLLFGVAILASCKMSTPLNVHAGDLAVESIALPDNWRETYRGETKLLDRDVVNGWHQRWEPVDSDTFTGFSLSVDEFESIAAARRGYRRVLRECRERGFAMEPLPEWTYESGFANQYAMYCSWPETTGEFCYSVARYANFVVIVGLDPGDGVTLEQAPELFGTIDQHVQATVRNANAD
jgi:hypothetical protein